MRVISKDEAIILWDKLNSEFKFKPGIDITGEWIIIPGNTKKYHKATPWSEKQCEIPLTSPIRVEKLSFRDVVLRLFSALNNPY